MTRRTRPYYGLFIVDGAPTDAPWGFAFGDHDKSAVEFELEDYLDKGWKRRELRMVTWATLPTQAQIDANAAELNAAHGRKAVA